MHRPQALSNPSPSGRKRRARDNQPVHMRFGGGRVMKIRLISAVISTLLALAGCASYAPGPLAEGQQAQSLHRRVTRTVDAQYLLYLPAGFSAHAERRYPLLIFLHGSGEAGADLDKL